MKYNKVAKFEIINGKGIGVSLFTQGCPYHCPGCFNPETWDYDKGKFWTPGVEEQFLKSISRKYITRVSFLGGEPLSDINLPDLLRIVKKIKEEFPQKKIWFYSGNTYENMTKEQLEVLSYADYLVDGPFILGKRDVSLPFRGSSNQRIIDIQATIEKGDIVLYE